MATAADVFDSLRAEIASWGSDPKVLKVHLVNGDIVPVAFPTRRNKWNGLQKTFESLQWAIVEGIDKEGAMLGRYEHPDLGDYGLIDLETEVPAAAAGNLALMLKAQDAVLRRLGDYHISIMDQQAKVIDILATRLGESEARTADAWNAVHAAVGQSASGGGGDEATELIRAVGPALAKHLLVKPNGATMPKPK